MIGSNERHKLKYTAANRSLFALKKRRPLYPFFFRLGPLALCMTSVILIGLMALLYLSQVGRAVSINQQLQDTHSQQAALQRQNQDLEEKIAQQRSPGAIAAAAKNMGMVPTNPGDVQIIVVPGLIPFERYDHQHYSQP